MAAFFTQLIGETVLYEQDIVNDSITNAVWSVDQPGATLGSPITTTTNSQVTFSSTVVGNYVLTVTLTLLSGQVLEGQARINVIAVRV